MKSEAFGSRFFCGKSYFEVDSTLNYLVFLPLYKYFKTVAKGSKVTAWKSLVLSDDGVKPPLMYDNSLNPGIN